jgi:hypothetical protein
VRILVRAGYALGVNSVRAYDSDGRFDKLEKDEENLGKMQITNQVCSMHQPIVP